MSYLLFMDESGHDGSTSYEVRGGISLPAGRVWPFTRSMRGLEGLCFGDLLANHGKEIKAIKLLQTRRLRLARARPDFPDDERQALCRQFLSQSNRKIAPTLEMHVAYSQAGVLFVSKLLELVKRHGGHVFAAVVPSGHSKPTVEIAQNVVRRDIVYLFERFYHFLEDQQETGILVLDESDRTDDKRFLRRMERYFSLHAKGKQHARLVLPTPLFTASEMSYPVMASDLVCYLVSQGYRMPKLGMDGPVREDFNPSWAATINGLKHEYVRTDDGGTPYTAQSIVFVAEPWPNGNDKGRR